MISRRYASFCGELKKKMEKNEKKKNSNERGKARNGGSMETVASIDESTRDYSFRGKYFVFSNED